MSDSPVTDMNAVLRSAAGREPAPAEATLPYDPRPEAPASLVGEARAIWESIMDDMDRSNAAALGHVTRRGYGSADGAARGLAPSRQSPSMNDILREAAGR